MKRDTLDVLRKLCESEGILEEAWNMLEVVERWLKFVKEMLYKEGIDESNEIH